jgi:hypothetical protein
MNIESLIDLWLMKGHGLYIGACIVMTVAVLAVEIVWLRKRYQRRYEAMRTLELDHDSAS